LLFRVILLALSNAQLRIGSERGPPEQQKKPYVVLVKPDGSEATTHRNTRDESTSGW
jgi:hypothetical protein